MLKDKHILLGVTGGIAAYKSADLVSRLIKAGAKVDVVMTKAATEFVSPLTFQTMSQSRVHFDMFGLESNMEVEHIALAQRPDVILIAPATANTIGKIANGIADNMLTTVTMASTARIIFAPAMNTNMYLNPITQENIRKLKDLGHLFMNTGEGRLACGDVGAGKMAEPVEIVEYLEGYFTEKDLVGKKIVVTAGPTIEAIDPVRYITNHSSGKMGYAIARNASMRGAEVVLISGPVNLDPPAGVKVVHIESTNDMMDAVKEYFDSCDALIKAAAPSDFRPLNFSDKKIKKRDNDSDTMSVELTRNPDIAGYFGKIKENRIMVGFAAETNDIEEYALFKMKEKNFDFIVANDVTQEGAGFKGDTNIVSIIDKSGIREDLPMMTKNDLSSLILDKVKSMFLYV
ncbi:bifunctional phosphopantothenoylcysteine decarboxylase/phosphopantothenate--cysteine ligase CoaBC [Gudongella sp. SC589]|jgi:phosphopantothenoylcysteine decarboxylase/phosphopantothenate--cysteine ligase|uniref:bifunctional phosphopantothenoylcysteine decarboxylase/phosphopantothenate--cysteine ligase CoaBC n=1 Tax=Gudongella sp. SC589 TaxID=3385990 RepID=UPI003904C486